MKLDKNILENYFEGNICRLKYIVLNTLLQINVIIIYFDVNFGIHVSFGPKHGA